MVLRSKTVLFSVLLVFMSIMLVACGGDKADQPKASTPAPAEEAAIPAEKAAPAGEADHTALLIEALQRPFGASDSEIEVWYRHKWGPILENMAVMGGTTVDDLLESAANFKAPIEEGKYVLLDVRTPAEYHAGHLPGAVSIPMGEFVHRLGELPADKDQPIIIYCNTDRRSGYANLITTALGYTNVKNAKKAWVKWVDDKIGPVETETSTMSPKVAPMGSLKGDDAIIAKALKRPFGASDPEIEVWYRHKWGPVLESMAVLGGTSVDELLVSVESFKGPIVDGKYLLLDVRTPGEYKAGHLPGAVSIPMGEFVHRFDELPADKDHPIFIYCNTDRRSGYAALVAIALGYDNVKNAKKAWVTWVDKKVGPIEQ